MKKALILFCITFTVIACKEKITVKEIVFEGNYVSKSYEKRAEGYDWIAVMISKIDTEKIAIRIRSRADKKKPSCTFDATAIKVNDSVYKAIVKEKAVLIKQEKNTITITTENKKDIDILNFFCSGGASIAQTYTKILVDFDQSQLDKTAFHKSLSLQNIHFFIRSEIKGKQEKITITPAGLSIINRKETVIIDGRITSAEIEDLNSDGSPELLIYTKNNTKGNVICYSVNNGKSMSQVYFPEIENDKTINEGYI